LNVEEFDPNFFAKYKRHIEFMLGLVKVKGSPLDAMINAFAIAYDLY
jgi:hypothetical protein